MSESRAVPIRTCLGCRQRKPASQLVRVGRGAAGLDVLGVAGSSVGAARADGQHASRVAASDLAPAVPRAQGVGNGNREADAPCPVGRTGAGEGLAVKGPPTDRPGKGAYICPDLDCAERALRLLGQPRTRRTQAGKDARSGPAAHREGGEDPAKSVLSVAAQWARLLADSRLAGLRRRRIEPSQDAQLGAWQDLAERIDRSLESAPMRGQRGHRRG